MATRAVDISFWVIQGLLLTPVLFLAASVGLEERPNKSRYAPLEPRPERRDPVGPVALAAPGLAQFTAEQQARLVILRAFVQEARTGRGALRDDMEAAIEDAPSPTPTPTGPSALPPSRARRLGSRRLLLASCGLLVVAGVVGVVRTSLAIDDLQATSYSRHDPLSPAARFLPGVIVSPGKYLSAVNGASASANGGDPLYAVSLVDLKQAMDRWEALAGIGLGLLLFVSVSRTSEDGETSVGSDVAPFVLVAAFLLAALSFFELP